MTILDRIVEAKREEVAAAQRAKPLKAVRGEADNAAPPRDFFNAVVDATHSEVRLIAEVKKASPSAGVIVPDFDPVRIARTYCENGAAALSVLTDRPYFQGSLEYIRLIRDAVALPVLRKDFILDEYQVYESRAADADAVLLITEVLGAQGVADLQQIVTGLGMTALVEVHSMGSLEGILDMVGPPAEAGYLLGINNRDLAVQRTDLATTARLAGALPQGSPLVSESGISTRADVLEVGRAGACAILVGESLLSADDIGAQVCRLLGR